VRGWARPYASVINLKQCAQIHPEPAGCNGMISFKEYMEENAATSKGSFPAQCTYFLPLLSTHPYNDQEVNKMLTAIFRGIYHIYPLSTVENYFCIIFSADDKKTIQMGYLMDSGLASITKWFLYAKEAI
jgi:hypothetical protein